MSINRQEALRRFDERYRSLELEIHDVSESTPKDCYLAAEFDAWYIRFRSINFRASDQAAFSVSQNRTAKFYTTDRLATRVNILADVTRSGH